MNNETSVIVDTNSGSKSTKCGITTAVNNETSVIIDRKETSQEKNSRNLVIEVDNPTIVSDMCSTISGLTNINTEDVSKRKYSGSIDNPIHQKKQKTHNIDYDNNHNNKVATTQDVEIIKRSNSPTQISKTQLRNSKKKLNRQSSKLIDYLYAKNLIPHKLSIKDRILFIYDLNTMKNQNGTFTCQGPTPEELCNSSDLEVLSKIIWKLSFRSCHYDLYCSTNTMIEITSKDQDEAVQLRIQETNGK